MAASKSSSTTSSRAWCSTPIGFGVHQQVAAHLAALAVTDFSVPRDSWELKDFHHWNATSRLAEDFIEKGHGLYQAGVGRQDAIYVSSSFAWTDLEREAFGHLHALSI